MELILNGGPILVTIVLVSGYALYVFLARFAALSRERLDTDVLMQRVNAAVRDRRKRPEAARKPLFLLQACFLERRLDRRTSVRKTHERRP
jgi:biopolymer transport protein ExbB/TolQ